MLPADFHVTLTAHFEGRRLLGGEPFALVDLSERAAARIRSWVAGDPVGEDGALARALVAANLAQPIPPSRAAPPVTVVIPVRDRSIAPLLHALESDDVIVVDDASETDIVREEARGVRYVRRDVQGGAAAARNDGLSLARHDLVACLDSDTLPLAGWLDVLLPHFADPELSAIAPRVVALDAAAADHVAPRRLARALRDYERERSPLDRGPDPARVIPYGRVPFVPGAALITRRHLRFDPTLRGGEDVEFVWRVPYVRYEPAAHVAHAHRTDPRAWFGRRVYYGRTAAGIAKRHPGKARPLNVSPWTTAAWLALAARRPVAAVGIVGVATALTAREVEPARAFQLAAVGSFRSGRVVADALTRAWWPLSAAAALHPKARLPLAAALATKSPLQLADDLAYGLGLWRGCIEQRTIDPLLPARPWRLDRVSLS
ncbi:mycofactocin biosynthesis glycosyltransferase MftF [Solirubrobacter soli]|uniref:mycofactocin biosynthesis glycosyltransferase MftF n=1 Tax=Solirubrobacter soli TaxID=363832 RepID=UPI000410616B|nr:mycofactocin biosynthesis glycosyltransferase MftF [Solirubrobacter soli]